MRQTLLLLLLLSCASGQRLSLGVIGGFSPTGAFRDRVQPVGLPPSHPGPPGLFPVASRSYSEAKDYILGASLEWQFTPKWSVEVDAMFRKLHMTNEVIRANGTRDSVGPAPVITWQFPVLAKYRLVAKKWTPFLEAGPSFRTAGNLNGTNPSHVGATAGLGVETKWGPLKFAPVVRYTRWKRDNPREFEQTASNQVEFLLNVSATAQDAWHPMGKHASIGVMFGTTITGDFPSTTFPFLLVEPPGSVVSHHSSGPRRLIVGPVVEFHLPRRLSVEIDALYRPVSMRSTISSTTGFTGFVPGAGVVPSTFTYSYVTWEFPVLVKQKFALGKTAPFIGVGPSFRRQQALSFSSPYGAVAGAGVEIPWGPLRVSPAVRYTRWASGRIPGLEDARLNQSEMLVGVTF